MSLPDKTGVYGGGRMGAGIAHALLVAGADVVVVETDPEAAAKARTRIDANLARSVERGITATGVLSVTTDAADLSGAGLVIEAVPEIPGLKASVLASIELAARDAVIASNTSSLSIDGLAAGLAAAERFVGLHFFNPVPASALVEVVVGKATAAAVVAQAQEWVGDLGKSAITVADSPGFASSRLGVAIALEAMRMLEEGVATAEDIDTAMTLGYRHPVGPLRTTDLVGLDVRLDIADHLEHELGPRFAPPQLLRDKVEAGELGRKSGKGFYTW
ncbi:3-hydroxybutyryl-CoA dehydrogenase [Nocardioides sp. YR527]|uniref:3-hydroxyacyl-CoA dehydrogenase family protein n=1 Tax=Nocardioides sp. YR527 TaxID=1881028 RepID=UPI000884BC1B|nr:3-hydroxyacyl-CoA dehydrogenase NAD-binding domain-containing protein [Nocardioides sp. YR527]SDK56912.1 3-hydroxybutyryl-CoA dehydrogenase [Nocardioides sp. YR527]